MTPTETLKQAYALLESLAVTNDAAGDALYPVLDMLNERNDQIVGAVDEDTTPIYALEGTYGDFRG